MKTKIERRKNAAERNKMKKNWYTEPLLEPDGGGAGAADEPGADPAAEDPPKATLKDALADEDVKAEFDAAIAEAVKKAQTEAEVAAKKAEEDKKKDPLVLAQEKIKALEAEKSHAALMTKVGVLVSESGLPSEFAQYLIGDDEETSAKNVTAFKAAYDAAVAAAVKEKLPGYDPKSGKQEETDPFLKGFKGGK